MPEEADEMDDVREQVRQRYALAAVQVTEGSADASCCGGGCGPAAVVDERWGAMPQVDDRHHASHYRLTDAFHYRPTGASR